MAARALSIGRVRSTRVWTPAYLAGLVLWLRADWGITLNGSNVLHWADQSYVGRDFYQLVAGNQPAYSPTGFAQGTPCVSFNGTTAFLLGPNSFAQGAKSIYIVFKNAVVPAASTLYLLAMLVNAANGSVLYSCNYGSYPPYEFSADTNATAGMGVAKAADTNPHVWGFTFNGGVINVPGNFATSIDGVAQPIVATSGAGVGDPFSMIGAYRVGPSQLFKGLIAEIFATNTVISSLDQWRIANYTLGRYGIN